MSSDSQQRISTPPQSVVLRARNIGGIDETEVTLHRGITALTGRNATNRTSLLQAIMAALGSDDASLKADADDGTAVLEVGDETYERTLHRRNGTVVTEGEPFLEDSEIADLFAFLLEDNEARRAVARGDDLRDIIMRPVDTDAIRQEISRTEQEKRDIDQQLSKLEDLSAKLPDLEQKRTRLTGEIEELREELAEAEESVEDAEAGVEETREEKDELDAKLDELQTTRSELERVRRRIDTERESIDALEDEREELADELDDAPERPDEEIDRLEVEIDQLQNEKEELTAEISQLQSTIQFNEEMLESAGGPIDASGDSDGGGNVTDQLLPDNDGETVECWTCGSSVARDQIETTVEQLRETRQERLDERSELSTALRETRSELSDLRDRRDEHERTRKKLDDVEEEIEERDERVERYEEQRSELTDEIAALEADVERLEDDVQDELLDQHKEVNELEFEIERLEEQREDVEDEIASIEERLDEREELEERRETVADELTDLRTRIDRIEADAVDAFNEHMEQVLDVLGYDNLDRIWIERTEREVRQGRRKVEKSSFDLKIVRSTDSGAAYEDDVSHLSESEREVTGLVFALAGYLVHDIHETVPFMLLDSLEAIDSARIADLIEYFRDHVPYLTVALLEEDAAALEAPHERVTEI